MVIYSCEDKILCSECSQCWDYGLDEWDAEVGDDHEEMWWCHFYDDLDWRKW